MRCDVERMLIADPTIIRNLCREGSHVEEVLLSHCRRCGGDSPTWGTQGRGPFAGPATESPVGPDSTKADIQHSQDSKEKAG